MVPPSNKFALWWISLPLCICCFHQSSEESKPYLIGQASQEEFAETTWRANAFYHTWYMAGTQETSSSIIWEILNSGVSDNKEQIIYNQGVNLTTKTALPNKVRELIKNASLLLSSRKERRKENEKEGKRKTQSEISHIKGKPQNSMGLLCLYALVSP